MLLRLGLFLLLFLLIILGYFLSLFLILLLLLATFLTAFLAAFLLAALVLWLFTLLLLVIFGLIFLHQCATHAPILKSRLFLLLGLAALSHHRDRRLLDLFLASLAFSGGELICACT